MCEICGQTPCAYRCPNAKQPKVFDYCAECGGELREDYDCYEDNEGNHFCSELCAIKFHDIKEVR